MKPMRIGRLPVHTQEWILTLARRGWCVAQVARAMQMCPAAVARCLDAWGVARATRPRIGIRRAA